MQTIKCFIISAMFLAVLTINHAQVNKLWETGPIYLAPESVAYDSVRGCIYVSNFHGRSGDSSSFEKHFITKADLQGNIQEFQWVKKLTQPLGICIQQDKLYIVDRSGVIVHDLTTNTTSDIFLIKDNKFINDISVDPEGVIYVTESDSDVIFRIKDGIVEKWLEDSLIGKPNGILYDNNKLIVGVNRDNYLKMVDIDTREISNIAYLGPGIIDGIKKCKTGYLVSLFQGNLLLVGLSGKVSELLNTRNEKLFIADFEYIESMNLVIIPALWNNILMGYQYHP